jgi:hypothetical protein
MVLGRCLESVLEYIQIERVQYSRIVYEYCCRVLAWAWQGLCWTVTALVSASCAGNEAKVSPLRSVETSPAPKTETRQKWLRTLPACEAPFPYHVHPVDVRLRQRVQNNLSCRPAHSLSRIIVAEECYLGLGKWAGKGGHILPYKIVLRAGGVLSRRTL